VIFIHIPKCAGTSVEFALGHLVERTGRGGQDHRTIRRIEQPFPTLNAFASRSNLREAAGRVRRRFRSHSNPNNALTVSREQYERYFKFTIVRNPWSRAFSWYCNVMRDPMHQHRLGVAAEISFPDFLETQVGLENLRTQLHWLTDFSGRIPLDYICRFENLHADFQTCCQRIGLDGVELGHEFQGPGGDYREAYDDRARARVAEAYREEIEFFGYTFEA
jgi:hypothetical protein